MDNSVRWRRPFIDLRRQFNEAVKQGHFLKVEFGYYENHLAFEHHHRRIVSEMHDRIHFSKVGQMSCGAGGCRTEGIKHSGHFRIYGDLPAVQLIQRLSEAAGACLPLELRPEIPLPQELIALDCFKPLVSLPMDTFDNSGVWLAFVFRSLFESGQCTAFTIEPLWHPRAGSPNWPSHLPKESGAVVAHLKLDAFQASLLAIGEILDEVANSPLSVSPDNQSTLSSPTASDSQVGFLGGADLVKALGVHSSREIAFFRQVERKRRELGDDCWHEVSNPKPNSPQFLYRADSAKLRDIAAHYKNPRPT